MAITLGGIALPDMIFDNEFEWAGIVASSEMTLGGIPIIWEDEASKGRPVDLVALPDQGWGPTGTSEGLTRGVVKSLMILAGTRGWTGTLDYEGVIYRVRFRHEDYPAIDLEPLIPRPNHADGDYYHGRIKLMEV